MMTHNGQTLDYDSNGNLLNSPFGNYNYDSRNRLTEAGTTTYTYDPENRRIAIQSPEGTTQLIHNPNALLSQLLVRKSPDGKTTYYIYGLGLLYQETDSQAKYYHFDHQGNTLSLTDQTGQITDQFAYSPYGETLKREGTTDTPFQYNGRFGVMTDSNGLLQMRARYYSPELKRFINQDILLGNIAEPITLNRFAYANGDPINNIDPFGLSANGNNTSPWQLGFQWLTGTGPQVQNFSDGDPMTVMLQQHKHIQNTQKIIANKIANGGNLQGPNNYGLSGFQGVPKYLHDYSTLLTGGLTGNLAVTYLGSYTLNYNVTGIDYQNGTATVNFHASNPSTITSALRPPVIGYTAWWNEYVGEPLNNFFQDGPMSPTTQNFDWTETIQWSQPQPNK